MTVDQAVKAIQKAREGDTEAVTRIYARALRGGKVPHLGWEPINFAVDEKVGRENRDRVKVAARG